MSSLKKILGKLAEGGKHGDVQIEGLKEIEQALGELPPEAADAVMAQIAASLENQEVPAGMTRRISFRVIQPPEPIRILAQIGPVFQAASQLNQLIDGYKEARSDLASIVQAERAILTKQKGRKADMLLLLSQAAVNCLNGLARAGAEQSGMLRKAIAENLPGVQGLEIPEPPAELAVPETIEALFALFPEESKRNKKQEKKA